VWVRRGGKEKKEVEIIKNEKIHVSE